MVEKFKSVKCPICDTVGEWKNVDQYRMKPADMCLCQKCGMVTYPDAIEHAAELKEFYREQYRRPPTWDNITTGERKLHFHAAFLAPVFDKWKAEKVNPVVCDVGAAFGMALNWMRAIFPEGKFFGTELTESYVRNAWHLYKLQLTDDIDTTQKYDMIMSYKVAEHQVDINDQLDKYSKCLAPGGYLYISVPAWFGLLEDFGTPSFTLENYYNKNHVNVWTRKLFEGLLKKHGFLVIEENHTMYNETYLCKWTGAVPESIEYENPDEIEKKMAAVYAATQALISGKFEDAVKAWPAFPEAHIGLYESSRSAIHQKGFEWIYENVVGRALNDCDGSYRSKLFAADLCMRYGKYDLALQYLDRLLGDCPNDATARFNISTCLRQIALQASGEAKIKALSQSRDQALMLLRSSQKHQAEAMTWAMDDNAKLPTPWEMEKQAKTDVK